MPGYTHLQRAEPVLVAHWLLAYVSMIERDLSRFADARARMNFCPLGSGAIAGATLALDRTIAAKALDFTAPTPNSIDATSDRDFMLDFAQAASTSRPAHLPLRRRAHPLRHRRVRLRRSPRSLLHRHSAPCRKRRTPTSPNSLRGKSARLLGASTALSTLVKGLPLAYNKDLQEGQEQVFDVADTLSGILSVLPGFTRALNFRADSMKTAATTGYLNAMAAATYLTHKGVPFRKAHEKIGHAVRFGLETRRELGELTLAELNQFGPEFGEDFYRINYSGSNAGLPRRYWRNSSPPGSTGACGSSPASRRGGRKGWRQALCRCLVHCRR